jgi:hypothetical protein
MVLIDGVVHLSALFCQQIESSFEVLVIISVTAYSLMQHIYRGMRVPRPIFVPSGRIIVLDDSLRRPFVIFLIVNV